MTPAETVPIVCSIISTGCALLMFVRQGRWRETDEGRALLQRLSDCESRIQSVEIRQEDLPTQADIERLRGEVHTVGEQVRGAAMGVKRIEDFWMQSARAPG